MTDLEEHLLQALRALEKQAHQNAHALEERVVVLTKELTNCAASVVRLNVQLNTLVARIADLERALTRR
jgi:hypothetical protein